MLTCKQTSQLISEGQERKLSLWEKLGLKIHLWMCTNCRRFEQQIHFIRQVLHRGWSDGNLPAQQELPTDARQRIRQKLLEESSQD